MSQSWLAQAIARASAVNDWLQPQRKESLALLATQEWPGRRTEAWRYTSLHAFDKLALTPAASDAMQADAPAVAGLNSLDIVLVDGELQTAIEALQLPSGVRVSSFSNADAQAQEVAQAVFTKVKPTKHLFGLLNDTLAQQGIIIDIAAGAEVQQPIRIVNYVTAGVESHNRILVRLGAGAKATIIEHGANLSGSDAAAFNTAFAEYLIGDKAQLEHYRLALHGGKVIHIGGSHFQLHNEARLNSTLVGYGSQISRIDADIHHAGEHAFAKFNNIYLLAPNEHFDLHSSIEHAVPNGTTEQNARGIVGDKAVAVFNGRIHIHRYAQKTLAELNNRNLLLTRGARVNTKPELEIYADDVQCAHGATVAEINEEALYYLRSRGLSASQAKVMLSFGFIQELITQMPNHSLADWLLPILRERFVAMEAE